MHIGNILKNTADGSVLGAVVYTYPNKLIIFRNINGLNPGIFKMPVEDLNNPMIVSAGTINQPEFEPIKKALLKYYRRGTLPESEKAVFGRIMEYAFPNGVPLFDDHAERMPDDATRAIRLSDHLQPGKCLYINTVQSGPFGHLDNQCVYVLGGDEHGIWICPHQSGTEFTTSYLPFKDRNVPKFWSVNRLLPGEVRDNKGAEYVGRFLAAKTQGGLASQINHTDTRMKLTHDPSTGRATIIMPQKWAGQSYDFATGTIKALPTGSAAVPGSAANRAFNLITAGLATSDNEPYVGPVISQPTTGLGITKEDTEHAKLAQTTLAELNEHELAFQDKVEKTRSGAGYANHRRQNQQQRGGGVADDLADAWAKFDMVDTQSNIIPDDNLPGAEQETQSSRRRLSSAESEDLAAVGELGNTPTPSDDEEGLGSETEDEQMFNEDNLEFLEEDEPVIELEKVQKIRQMPVPELEKVFKESIQKGHIYKQKLEKLPALLRDNPLYKDRITKDVNVISLLKAQMTTESRMVLAQPADFHPVIESLLRNDYTNHFLVPLVVTTKKLYLTKKDPISREDLAGPTAAVEADFHKYMSEWCSQNARGGMRKMVDINENLTRIMTEAAPHLPATTSTLGLMVRFGEGIRPGDTRNRDTTVKLKTTRAQEDLEYLAQATQAIRFGFGGREFQLRNFAVDSQPFDSHVVLGPIGNYSNIPKTEYTIAEIEAMEEEIDKNIATVGSIYNIAYMGDNVNLVGFVRPPIMNFLQGRGENMPSLANELSNAEDKGQIVIRYLDGDQQEPGTVKSLDDPDKFIVYLFQDPGAAVGSGPTLTDDILRGYLGRIVPRFEDITRLFTDTYRVEQPSDLERLIEILYKFDYIIPHREGLSLAASRTQPETHLRAKAAANWENTKALQDVEDRIVRAMVAYNNKMDKIHRLRVMRGEKNQERKELIHGLQTQSSTGANSNELQLITPGLIELADKIYGEKYLDIAGSGEHAALDENKLDYYAHQSDRAQYINLLLRKTSLARLQELLSITELESSLAVLKTKYEASGRALPADLTTRVAPETLEKTQLGKCAGGDGQGGGRKPRILRYPSLARMKEDNGKTATTPAGDLVLEGDYAMVDEAGKKLIFRRETLNDGDFWIGQPISILEQLLFKKRATCAAVGGPGGDSGKVPTQDELDTARAAMKLPEEQLVGTDSDPDKTKNLQLGKDGQPSSECIFDVSRLQCLPVDIVDMDRDLADIQAQIMDVNGQLAFARALPPLIAECEKSIAAVEKEIRNYNHGVTLVEKYYTALVAQQQKELEALVKRRRDCPHFAVVQYLEGLLNLSDQERYMLVKEIINRFQNQEQASKLDLLVVASDSKHNNIECHVCSQTLLCKHYLYALELIENSDNGRLDDKALQAAYGEVIGGTYYCRGCGAPLGNTEVLDIEEFEKDGGKEGVHVKTREVMEDITVVERQKAAVDKIITAALNDETDDDMKTKLRIYKLAKDLLGLVVMSVEDELAIVNFLKTYDFLPRKTFYNLIYMQFVKARGGVTTGINKAAIDGLANEQFWRHAICDILGHLLVIIQTSIQSYTVFNKLCATNNYMGWPLLSAGGAGADTNIPEEDQGGIELMFCVMKQIALLPEFRMLGGADGTDITKLRNLIVKRIDEQIRNNEMVRTRLDRALDTKFSQISLLEEFRLNATNFWSSYRPVMAGTIPGGVKWTPVRDLDMSAVRDWSAKGHSAMVAAGHDNVSYQAQVFAHNLTSVIEKEVPANRIMLVNTVANSCCPIDYSLLVKSGVPVDRASNENNNANTETTGKSNKSKYLNPEINYYMNLERENEPIRNALRRIGEYSKMLKILERAVAPPRVRLTFPYTSKDFTPKEMALALEGDDLQAYFLKFIDSGPFKGDEHIFDPFGRCIVSGALKSEVAVTGYAQSDFEKLLAFVERQKVIKDPRALASQLSGAIGLPHGTHPTLTGLVAAMEKNPVTAGGKLINLEQLVEMAPRVNELLDHDCTFNKELEDLTKDFELLGKLGDLASQAQQQPQHQRQTLTKRIAHLMVIIAQMEKLAIGRLNELMVTHLGWGFREFGVGAKETNRVKMGGAGAYANGPAKHGLPMDYKKEYYGLITMIDTERQSEITGIVDAIGGNKKEELGLEQTLINIGALRDISRDLREFMDNQERIVPHYEYVNHDREQEIQHQIVRADFVRKLVYDVRTLVVQIKNEAWIDYKSAADVPDYIREFYKYKDAARVFGTKLAGVTLVISEIAGRLDEIQESSIFGAEVVVGLLAYLFMLMLGGMVSQVADGQPDPVVKLTVPVAHGGNGQMGGGETVAVTPNSDNEFDFVAAVDRAKGRAEPSAADQGSEYLVTRPEGNGEDSSLDDELGIYPEFIAEPTANDPIQAHEEFAESHDINLGAAAKEVKTTQRRVVIDFVRDVVLYAQRMEHIYNEMNLDRIREQMARTQEKQTKLNLAAPKFLKQEGMEDDYRIVMNMINLGFMKYKDLNNYMQDHYGDDVFRQGEEEADDRPEFDGGDDYGEGDAADAGAARDEEAYRNKYGLDNAEMAEMGFVGAQEDMEEMDYGYMGVDEA